MMDDSMPTQERRKLVKTYKNVLPQKRTVVVKYAGRSTPNNVIKLSRKTATDVINPAN